MPTATNPPLTDQIANISPLTVVCLVAFLTVVRALLYRNRQGWARSITETCDTINFVLILAFLLVRPFVAQAFYIPSASMRQTLLEKDRLIVDKFSYRLNEPRKGDVVVFNAPPEATDEGVDGIDFIKRLVAVPGDEIEVRPARLHIGSEVVTWDGTGGVHDYLRGRLSQGDEAIKLFSDHILIGGTKRLSKEEIATQLGVPGAPVAIYPGQTLVNGKVMDEPYTREDPAYRTEPTRLKNDELYMLGDNRNLSRDSHIWGPLKRERVVGHARFVFWPVPRIGAIR